MELRRSRSKYSSIDGVSVSAVVSGISDMHMHEIISGSTQRTKHDYNHNDNSKPKRREWHDNSRSQRMDPSMAPSASDRSHPAK